MALADPGTAAAARFHLPASPACRLISARALTLASAATVAAEHGGPQGGVCAGAWHQGRHVPRRAYSGGAEGQGGHGAQGGLAGGRAVQEGGERGQVNHRRICSSGTCSSRCATRYYPRYAASSPPTPTSASPSTAAGGNPNSLSQRQIEKMFSDSIIWLFPVQSVDINMNYFPEKLQALNLRKLGSPPAERSMDISALEKALRLTNIRKDGLPAAVHSIVISAPSGTARTHRFATQTVELPAEEGERVTISLAAPSNVYREMGPLKISARSQGFKPGEPMCITNHINGQVSKLLRAPSKNEGSFFVSPYLLVGALALLASGDAASAFMDSSLPRLIAATAVASAAVGTTLKQVVLAEIQKLPRKAVDIVAARQQLLSQYDILQSRLNEMKQFAEKEVWMLARMCQLDNKILAVGEPSYRARRGRVKRVRESLESTLLARIELMESYAKLCSMIEIEVEMDSDVIAAEAASSAERISEQIQQLMEIDSLEEQWRIQAEANDEAERLLSSDSSETLPAGRV